MKTANEEKKDINKGIATVKTFFNIFLFMDFVKYPYYLKGLYLANV